MIEDQFRLIDIRMRAQNARIRSVEVVMERQPHILRALYLIMEATGVPKDKRIEWLADVVGDTKA